jgi:DNA-binding transcriptional ArsR family regulator
VAPAAGAARIFLDSYIPVWLCTCVPAAFAVLAEPHRVEILNVLRDGEASVGELVAHLGLSQPGVSKHLRVLREAGLVVARADRQQRVYRLETGPLREIEAWLEPYRRRWSASLDRLDDHLTATRHDKPNRHRRRDTP